VESIKLGGVGGQKFRALWGEWERNLWVPGAKKVYEQTDVEAGGIILLRFHKIPGEKEKKKKHHWGFKGPGKDDVEGTTHRPTCGQGEREYFSHVQVPGSTPDDS